MQRMHDGLMEDSSIVGGGWGGGHIYQVHTALGPKWQTPTASTGCVECYVIFWSYLHPPHTHTHTNKECHRRAILVCFGRFEI